MIAPQPDSPIPPEIVVPTEPVTGLGEPSGTGLSQLTPSPPGQPKEALDDAPAKSALILGW